MRLFFEHTEISDPNSPSLRGGQLVVLRHLEVLRDAGIDAQLVAPGGTWFAPDRIIPRWRFLMNLTHDDLVIVPGRFVGELDQVPGQRKVLFIQGAGITFRALGVRAHEPSPWHRPDLEGVVCVSSHNAGLLRGLLPRERVHVIPNTVDPSVFRYQAQKEKILLVPPMDRGEKDPWHTAIVIQRLRALGALRGWQVIEMAGLPRLAARDLLERAAILLFLSTHEGFGLLPLEMQATGGAVVSWNTGPMVEVVPEEHRLPFGDVYGVVELLDDWLNYGVPPRSIEAGRLLASAYPPETQRELIIRTWSRLLEPEGITV